MKAFVFAFLIAQSAAASIHGVVVSSAGKPVGNAQVVAYPVEETSARMLRIVEGRAPAPLAKTTSANDGSFTLDVPGYGVVIVGVTVPDFAPLFQRAVLGDNDVVLPLAPPHAVTRTIRSASGAVRGARVIVIERNGEFEGRSDASGKVTLAMPVQSAVLVFADGYAPQMATDDRDVVLDRGVTLRGTVAGPNGAVAGARISINGVPFATSAADGTFTVAHAPSSRFFVGADDGSLFGMTDDPSATTVKIAAHPSVAVRGVVRDAQQHPLRGIAIATEDGREAVSGASGAYVLHIAAGKARLVASGEYEASGSIDAHAPLTHDIVATRVPQLAGIVKMHDGSPVAGTLVTGMYDDAKIELALASTITRNDGRFHVLMPSGVPIRLFAAKDGLPPAESDRITSAAKEIVITVPKPIDVALRVSDATRNAISGVTVREGRTRPFAAQETAADGTATLHLAEGAWRIALEKTGYVTTTIDVQVDAKTTPIEARLESALAIRGRVVTSDGNGVSGMFVVADDTHFAQTREDGSFELENLAAGPYELRYFSTEGVTGTQGANAPANDVRIVLARGRDVRGRVVDASGAPVTEFRIRIAGSPSFGAPREVSSPDGAFEWKNAPADDATITVMADGFPTKSMTIDAATRDAITIVLSRGRTIRGKVTNRAGEPIGGVTVQANDSPAPPEHAEEIATSADGTYEVRNVGGDAGAVTFRKEGFVAASRFLAAGTGDVRIDAQLAPAHVVTGHVLTAAGQPVANAEVTTESAAIGAESESATTNDDGMFTIALAPARYDFTARAEGIEGHVIDVDIEKTGDVTIRLAAPTKAVISGSVIGAPDARLTEVTATAADGANASATTDAQGKFRIDNAPLGLVTMQAVAMSATPRFTKSASIEIAPNSETHVDLTFPQLFAISGRVMTNESPLPAATISFSRDDESTRAVTNDAGAYDAKVSGGHYRIDVQASALPGGYATERDINAAGTVDITVDVAHLTVSVVDSASRAPVDGASVSTRVPGAQTHEVKRGTTPASGQITIAIPAGVTELAIEKSGYATAVASIDGSSITVPLTRAEGAVVRLIDARDGRALNGYAIARDAAGRVVASASDAAPDGAMRLPLLPGTYRFSASANGYGSQTITADIPTTEVRISLPRSGKLLLQSQAPMNAKARLIEPDGEEYVRCWCSGVAEIDISGRTTLVDSVAPGSYVLEVTPAGAKPRRIPVSVIEGETTPVAIDGSL